MTTLRGFRATCRCGVVFTTYAPSTLPRSAMESDYRDDYGPEDPSPYFIHTCPSCSFTAPREMFDRFTDDIALAPGAPPAVAPPRVQHVVAEHTFAWPIVELTDGPHTETACRWLLVAETYAKDGLDTGALANALLRASHHARVAGERAFESAAQREARGLYLKRVREDEVDDEERAGTSYLIGELSRRLGDFHEAVRWLDAAAALADAPEYVAAMRRLAARGESAPVALTGAAIDRHARVQHGLDALAARLPRFVMELDERRRASTPAEDAITIGFDEATRVDAPPRTHGARLFRNDAWRVHEVIGGYELLEPRAVDDWPPAWRLARCRGPNGWRLVEWCDFGYEREHAAADPTWRGAQVAAHLERRLRPHPWLRATLEMGVVDPTAPFDPFAPAARSARSAAPAPAGDAVPPEVGDVQSLVYLVDEYLPGVSLAQLLVGPTLPLRLAQLVVHALPVDARASVTGDGVLVDVVVEWDGAVQVRELFRFPHGPAFAPRHGRAQAAREASDEPGALVARACALADVADLATFALASDAMRVDLEAMMAAHLAEHFGRARADEERWRAQALALPASPASGRRTSPIAPFARAAMVLDVDGVEMVRLPPTGPHPRGSDRPLLVDLTLAPARGLAPHDAIAWAAQRGKRLPTEDEWDRLARGPIGAVYEWGDEAPGRDRAAIEARAIGANAWGVRDLGLPYWELTTTPAPNRKDGVVVRGGQFRDAPGEPHRLTSRSYEDSAAPDLAFRCVRDVDDE